ncbi:MAG: RhuM family protein, partial [Desulfobacteraceae bacterium]
GQAMRRIPMYMSDWIKKLDSFMTLNDRDILTHAGKISHEMAKQLAEGEYDKFHTNRMAESSKQISAFDKAVKQIESSKKKGSKS